MPRLLLGLLIWVGLSFAAGAIGSLATTPNIPEWYARLNRPAWTPPNWVFGPVWSALYLLMGIAAWLVWRRVGLAAGALPLCLFIIQLVLNTVWSLLFFGLHRPDLAFGEIIVLWLAIFTTMVTFWRVVPLGGALLLPYLLWVGFAAALNLAIWRLNP